MKRVACVLTVLGILCVAAGQAQAHDFYHHTHHGTVILSLPHWVAPQVVVAVPPPPAVVYPQVFYPPVYRYRYYEPVPRAGFYYQGRGWSLGVGW